MATQMAGMEHPADGLGALWGKITGARRRSDSPPAAERPTGGQKPPPISIERAAAGQQKQRFAITAKTMADSYIASIAKGDFAYRVLKDEFDAFCEEAEIDPVSDRQFGLWLQAAGGVKYRALKAKITMYRIRPRRMARAA